MHTDPFNGFYGIVPTPSLTTILGQHLRRLIKATIWDYLTTAFKLCRMPLQTVQVLVVDRPQGKVLLLCTQESPTGWFPVQGLRDKSLLRIPPAYDKDARTDALRELFEEALDEAAAVKPISHKDLRLLRRYREGRFGQFDCRAYLLEADSRSLPLKAETAEGLPVWMSIADAQIVLNPVPAALLAQLPPAGQPVELPGVDEIGAERQIPATRALLPGVA